MAVAVRLCAVRECAELGQQRQPLLANTAQQLTAHNPFPLTTNDAFPLPEEGGDLRGVTHTAHDEVGRIDVCRWLMMGDG